MSLNTAKYPVNHMLIFTRMIIMTYSRKEGSGRRSGKKGKRRNSLGQVGEWAGRLGLGERVVVSVVHCTFVTFTLT